MSSTAHLLPRRPYLGSLLALGAVAVGLWASSGLALMAWHHLPQPAAAGTAGTATLEGLVQVSSAGCAAAIIGWYSLALALSILVAGLQQAGRCPAWLRATLARISPPLLARVAASVLGLSLITAPAAWAAPTPQPAVPASASLHHASTSLDPSWMLTPGTPTSLDPQWAASPPAAPAHAEVVVHRGDTLWSIAQRHLGQAATPAQVASEWPRWFAVNAEVIGPNPDLIRPGQRLQPPSDGAR